MPVLQLSVGVVFVHNLVTQANTDSFKAHLFSYVAVTAVLSNGMTPALGLCMWVLVMVV